MKPLWKHLAIQQNRLCNLEDFLDRSSGSELDRIRATIQEVQENIEKLVKEHMPSGSGFNAGTEILYEYRDRPLKGDMLVFKTSFHHMNDGGYYDGWTEHKVIIEPCLMFDFKLKVTGRDRDQIKDYIGDVFHEALTTLV